MHTSTKEQDAAPVANGVSDLPNDVIDFRVKRRDLTHSVSVSEIASLRAAEDRMCRAPRLVTMTLGRQGPSEPGTSIAGAPRVLGRRRLAESAVQCRTSPSSINDAGASFAWGDQYHARLPACTLMHQSERARWSPVPATPREIRINHSVRRMRTWSPTRSSPISAAVCASLQTRADQIARRGSSRLRAAE